jgi:hypothetical protein
VNHWRLNVNRRRSDRWMFSVGGKTIDHCQDIHWSSASGNRVKISSASRLSNLINDCLLRGEMEFSEIKRNSRMAPCKEHKHFKVSSYGFDNRSSVKTLFPCQAAGIHEPNVQRARSAVIQHLAGNRIISAGYNIESEICLRIWQILPSWIVWQDFETAVIWLSSVPVEVSQWTSELVN